MAEKKIQENPLPEEQQTQPEAPANVIMKPEDKADKPAATIPITPTPRISLPSLTKNSPNELYHRLLPAALFLLTFVTVMTMLLIYMDTVALGAQQFRLNMSRDYELSGIAAESAALVAYVRQLHMTAPAPPPPPPPPSPQVALLDQLLGPQINGTFVDFLSRGARDPTGAYLEGARGWRGVVARAAAADFLALRGRARALHACLAPGDHPREVTYQEAENRDPAFSSRVLCLPLATVLLATAPAGRVHHLLLDHSPHTLPALARLPSAAATVYVLEIRVTDQAARNKTTEFLKGINYTVAATLDDGVMYKLVEA